jgi:hypothetical protein
LTARATRCESGFATDLSKVEYRSAFGGRYRARENPRFEPEGRVRVRPEPASRRYRGGECSLAYQRRNHFRPANYRQLPYYDCFVRKNRGELCRPQVGQWKSGVVWRPTGHCIKRINPVVLGVIGEICWGSATRLIRPWSSSPPALRSEAPDRNGKGQHSVHPDGGPDRSKVVGPDPVDGLIAHPHTAV